MDEDLPFCRGWLRSRSDLWQNSDEQSLTCQVDFEWALWRTKKQPLFSESKELSPKAIASNVAS